MRLTQTRNTPIHLSAPPSSLLTQFSVMPSTIQVSPTITSWLIPRTTPFFKNTLSILNTPQVKTSQQGVFLMSIWSSSILFTSKEKESLWTLMTLRNLNALIPLSWPLMILSLVRSCSMREESWLPRTQARSFSWSLRRLMNTGTFTRNGKLTIL